MQRHSKAFIVLGAACLLVGAALLAWPRLPWLQLTSAAEDTPDEVLPRTFTGAIAVRVYRNPNRLDPMAWYRDQDFAQGSPRQTTVSGYPAVEEGSSVYVAAPNIVSTCSNPPCAYVNVYLMSHSLGSVSAQADPTTAEIARRMRENWEFLNGQPPVEKEMLQRDNLRLTVLGTLAASLQRYRQRNGSYPQLAAGTYLPGRSVSTWPSWSGTLSAELGEPAGVDPVNSFDTTWPYDGPSQCDSSQGFASTTCYAAPGTPGGGSTGAYRCPAGSHVLEYETGANTRLYTNFEYKNIRWPSGLLRGTVDVPLDDSCRSFFIDMDARGSSWGSSWPLSS